VTAVNADDFYKMDLKKTHYFINIGSSSSGSGGLAGKRLAVLADFHNRDHEPVLDVLRDDIPDAIMIPGDIIHGFFPQGEKYVIDRCPGSIAFLEGCSEIAPTYMSVGNHEALLCSDEYDMLRAAGVTVLDNEFTELRFRNDHTSGKSSTGPSLGNNSAGPSEKIFAGGLTSAHTLSYNRFRDDHNRENGTEGYERYPYRKKPKDLDAFPADSAWLDDFEQADGYRILMCHHPEYWCLREPMLRDRKIDLVLSGHAHGGQWRFMGHGILAPGQGLLPKYTGGIYDGQYGSMIVSRGLSNPYRFVPRWGNPCEIVYVEFRI